MHIVILNRYGWLMASAIREALDVRALVRAVIKGVPRSEGRKRYQDTANMQVFFRRIIRWKCDRVWGK